MPASGSRYCLRCRYQLDGIDTRVCPECARPFDPTDPRTTAASPTGDLRIAGASFARALASITWLFALIAVVASALIFDPLWLWMGAIALTPFMLILLLVVAIPAVPVSPRMRAIAVAGVLLLVSTVLTNWPMRLTFLTHRAGFDQRVTLVQTEGLDAPGATNRIGLLHILAVKKTGEGNIGFQLTGDGGGGVFLVHQTPDCTFAWYNTNWERPLGGPWVLVYED